MRKENILPPEIAELYERNVNAVVFITKHPDRQKVDLRKIDIKTAKSLEKQGYLKIRKQDESKAKG